MASPKHKPVSLDAARAAIVRVKHGRGFVVEGKRSRLVFTAAHCVKSRMTCASYADHEISSILGRLGKRAKVWAECFFIDPIADIAVLGPPDDQRLFEQFDEWEALIDEIPPIRLSECQPEGAAWLLSLDGEWQRCKVKRMPDGPIWIEEATHGIIGGMSGSPIVADDGSAIGIVCVANSMGGGAFTQGGPNAELSRNLPGWLLRDVGLL